jgi:CRP-like cAMP-binding protein
MHASHSTPLPKLRELALSDPPHPWLAGFELRHWSKGALIAVPGDAQDRTLLVRSGQLRVYLSGANRDLSLAFLEPGDLYTTHTPTYVEASQASDLWMMDTRRFAQRLASDPTATPAMMRVLGQLLRNAVTLIEDLAFREVPARLARFLVEQVERRGLADGPTAWRIPLAWRMEDLASLLGTTRQTVSALVNQWEREGLVLRLGRRELRVCDLATLRDLAAT